MTSEFLLGALQPEASRHFKIQCYCRNEMPSASPEFSLIPAFSPAANQELHLWRLFYFISPLNSLFCSLLADIYFIQFNHGLVVF